MVERSNLLTAVGLASRGRQRSPAVLAFKARLDAELEEMGRTLLAGRPHCGCCHTFTIHDPKERRITAPVFRERVLHQAVMAVAGPVLDRRLFHHCHACRTGKGTGKALAEARRCSARADWFVKLDVRKYFESIPHDRLFEALEGVFRERKVLDILRQLVSAYRPGSRRGLAIGTLVSQHLANFYLAPLDTHLLQVVRPLGYVRYMDDLALWFADRGQAKAALDGLGGFLAGRLALEFKTAYANRTAHGLDFLGHRVFPGRIELNRRSRRRYQRRMGDLHRDWASGAIPEVEAQARAVSLTAATLRADCLGWRRGVLRALEGRPTTGAASCVAEAGTTTAGTPRLASAMATLPGTGTTTSVSGPVPAPSGDRSLLVEQACLPVPVEHPPDKPSDDLPPVGSRAPGWGPWPRRAAGPLLPGFAP